MKIVVVGAGGHSKVIIDAIQATNLYDVVGVLSHGGETRVLGVPVIGGDDTLPALAQQGVEGAFIAIGDNKIRQKLSDAILAFGLMLVNVIHPSAVIAPSVMLGRGIAVLANAVINADSRIGDNVIVNTGATVDHDALIGVNVHIAPGCHLAGNVCVGAGTFLGIGTCVIPNIVIGEGVITGAGTTIYCDVEDGRKVVSGGMRYL